MIFLRKIERVDGYDQAGCAATLKRFNNHTVVPAATHCLPTLFCHCNKLHRAWPAEWHGLQNGELPFRSIEGNWAYNTLGLQMDGYLQRGHCWPDSSFALAWDIKPSSSNWSNRAAERLMPQCQAGMFSGWLVFPFSSFLFTPRISAIATCGKGPAIHLALNGFHL